MVAANQIATVLCNYTSKETTLQHCEAQSRDWAQKIPTIPKYTFCWHPRNAAKSQNKCPNYKKYTGHDSCRMVTQYISQLRGDRNRPKQCFTKHLSYRIIHTEQSSSEKQQQHAISWGSICCCYKSKFKPQPKCRWSRGLYVLGGQNPASTSTKNIFKEKAERGKQTTCEFHTTLGKWNFKTFYILSLYSKAG